jgi:hypothetical protein
MAAANTRAPSAKAATVDKFQGENVLNRQIETAFNHTDKVTKESTSGTLSIELNAYRYANYEAVYQLECDIKLRVGRAKKAKTIGDLDGFVVNPEKTTDKGRKLWVTELLQDSKEFAHAETTEVRDAVQRFFTKGGKPCAAFKEHADKLNAERIVFVDSFKLFTGDDSWQGKGIGPQIMKLFHDMMRDKVFSHKDTVLCLLRPGRIPDDKIGNEYGDVEVEKKLQASYEKSGYETWVQGNAAEENNFTYMAQVL